MPGYGSGGFAVPGYGSGGRAMPGFEVFDALAASTYAAGLADFEVATADVAAVRSPASATPRPPLGQGSHDRNERSHGPR